MAYHACRSEHLPSVQHSRFLCHSTVHVCGSGSRLCMCVVVCMLGSASIGKSLRMRALMFTCTRVIKFCSRQLHSTFVRHKSTRGSHRYRQELKQDLKFVDGNIRISRSNFSVWPVSIHITESNANNLCLCRKKRKEHTCNNSWNTSNIDQQADNRPPASPR